jgi:aminoacyl tRNA synthase complex-interacting multifunctional protein 1|tara:strand:- start:6 stop:1010 length:1005 start_codon:yes stop_codon:yes gene_type:complete
VCARGEGEAHLTRTKRLLVSCCFSANFGLSFFFLTFLQLLRRGLSHSSRAMSAIDAAAAKVTELAMTDRIRVDPADPWCDIWNPPPSVYKERCIHTGYLMTKPFEQNNPMPGQFSGTSDYIVAMLKPVIKTKGGAPKPSGDAQPKKEKKEKAPKTPQPSSDEDPFTKAKLVIGKVIEVAHVENSDKLYCCKVQVSTEEGEGSVKQVITGLRKFVPEDELRSKMVLCILNLKVAKLAGQTSEAMILATEADVGGETQVRLVGVPEGAQIGELVSCEGIAPGAAGYPKECKSKFWDLVKEKLKVRNGCATYDGKKVGCAAGPCVAEGDVPEGASIK